jgi:hypothetical protein
MSRDRDDRDKYRGDVFYETWRRGGDPDRVDVDRVTDAYYDGLSASEFVSRQQQAELNRRQAAEYEQYVDEQQGPQECQEEIDEQPPEETAT